MRVKSLNELISEVLKENYGELKNKLVGDHIYKGYSDDWANYIINTSNFYHSQANPTQKKQIENIFNNYYDSLVKLNGEDLKNINVNQQKYNGYVTPKMDVVLGVASGIPPLDIKNYVELTKGAGGNAELPQGYERVQGGKEYIQIKPSEQSPPQKPINNAIQPSKNLTNVAVNNAIKNSMVNSVLGSIKTK